MIGVAYTDSIKTKENGMRIDAAMLEKLLKEDDDHLWHEIVALAKKKGFTLPEKTPAPAEMQKLRGVLAHPEKIDMLEAFRLLNHFRKGK